jgi:hypothetical protein
MPYKDRDANRVKINTQQREYARRWRKERPEHFREHHNRAMAKYMLTSKYREFRKRFKESNPERWNRLLELSRQYYKEHRDEINKRDKSGSIDLNSDRYLIRSLQNEGLSRKLIKEYPELIEAKRLLLNIKRQVK